MTISVCPDRLGGADQRQHTAESVRLRPMRAADAGPVSDFLLAQYAAFNAVDNTGDGHRVFRDFVARAALRTRLAAGSVLLLAERQGLLLGVCELHRDGYLTLLYVRGDHQGRGIGGRLLRAALARLRAEAPGVRRIRVRATPYARGFYESAGFRPAASGLRWEQGLCFHPLVLDLPRPMP